MYLYLSNLPYFNFLFIYFSQVVVGSGRGRMVLFDFRQQKVIHAYRGFTGSIRELVCHPTSPLIASVGLDRFLRVHHLDQQAPLFKSYLKSRFAFQLFD